MEAEQVIRQTTEFVEIPLAEYEAIKVLAAGIADQNQTVLTALKALVDETATQRATVTGALKQMAEALSALNITVNVPEQPAPVVSVTPNINVQPADVKVNVPKPKREVQAVQRNADGLITSTETKIEY